MSKIAPYQEIANTLRDQILSGELAPGEELPSENALAARFKCVRSTAARALEQLRREGLITTTQGKPSKVRSRPQIFYTATGENFRRRQGTGKPNDIAEAEAQDQRGENELLAVELVPASAEIAERLGLEVESTVVMRYQLNRVDGEPMKVMRCYYRQDFAEGTP